MYWFAYIISFLFIRFLYPCRIVNKENIKDGGMILVSNHMSNLDGVYIAEYLPYRKHYFLAKKELFKGKLLAKFMEAIGGIKVDRQKVDLSAIKTALSVLKQGKKLVIFPEGTRNKENESLQEIKNGTAMLAIKGQVPIIPLNIAKRGKAFRRQRIFVGKPFELAEFYGQKLSAEVLEKASEIIETNLKISEEENKKLEKNKQKNSAN